jgi:hypothetical protein
VMASAGDSVTIALPESPHTFVRALSLYSS